MRNSFDKHVPQIRFPEFTEPWEQRKLGDLSASFEYGLNAAAKDFDGEHKYIRITDIDDDSRCFIQENVTSPNTDLSEAEKYKLVSGDILFARTGASVGKTYIYRSSDGLVYYAGFLIRARIKSDYNPEFVFQNTLTSRYSKFISLTSMRSGQPGVNAQEYSQFEMMMPSRAEQDKICECLNGIDNLITLHQRKCDDLKIYKKGLLQQMFLQPGEAFPRVRFPGFTEPWEQRKLSDVADIIGGGTPSTDVPEYWDGDIDWYAPAEINDQIYVDHSERKITQLGLDKSSAKILPANKTLLFTSRAGIGKTAILQHDAATNQGFQSLVLNDDTNPYFVYTMTEMIKEKAEKVASGSTFAEISGKMLGKLEFMFPTYEEQVRIGDCFKHIDNIITLHQRKCDELKMYKKGLLQKMFV